MFGMSNSGGKKKAHEVIKGAGGAEKVESVQSEFAAFLAGNSERFTFFVPHQNLYFHHAPP